MVGKAGRSIHTHTHTPTHAHPPPLRIHPVFAPGCVNTPTRDLQTPFTRGFRENRIRVYMRASINLRNLFPPIYSTHTHIFIYYTELVRTAYILFVYTHIILYIYTYMDIVYIKYIYICITILRTGHAYTTKHATTKSHLFSRPSAILCLCSIENFQNPELVRNVIQYYTVL